MPEYLSPGIFIQEKSEGARAIAGVGTSTCVFPGIAERGPVDGAVGNVPYPLFITGYADYETKFGRMNRYTDGGLVYEFFDLPQSVAMFFNKGGLRAYIARLIGADSETAKIVTGANEWTIWAGKWYGRNTIKEPGKWGNRVSVTVTPNQDYNPLKYDVAVFYQDTPTSDVVQVEAFTAVDFVDAASPAYFPEVINAGSNFIWAAKGIGGVPAALPSGTSCSGGTEGTAITQAIWGSSQSGALASLNSIDEMFMLVAPDQMWYTDGATAAAVQGSLIDYADYRKYVFAICTPPSGLSPQDSLTFMRTTLNKNSQRYAMYYPWVKIQDPLNVGRPKLFPPVGLVAGVYASTDNNRNVAKAPAGITDGALSGIIDLERTLTKAERDLIYPARINPLISTPQTGRCVWGARTGSLDSLWRYVPVVRTFQFLEKSTFDATHWIVFENNDAGTRLKAKLQMESFLLFYYNEGYFAGNTPEEAFFVVCDETNNPPEAVESGFLYIKVGVSPQRPAEFVVFQFMQKTASAK